MSVNFYLDKRPDKAGDVPVRVSIAVAGARFVTSAGVKVTPSKWDDARQRARRGSTMASGVVWNAINARLAAIADYFLQYENRCVADNVAVTSAMIREVYGREFGSRRARVAEREQVEVFWRWYDEFVRERGAMNAWTKATYQKFAALAAHLRAWRSEPRFSDFTHPGLTEFVGVLRDVRGLKNSTIGKQLGFLRWFLRWATARGVNDCRDFETFSPKLKTAGAQVVFLEWDELMRVLRYEVPPEGTDVELTDWDGRRYVKRVRARDGLERTRDVFCFCAFTSLRFSDAMNLRASAVVGGVIRLTTIKTADTITIELNKYALEVLRRQRGRRMGGMALPYITNQRMNMYLKDLLELCGINRPVTRTHYRGNERIDVTAPKWACVGTHTARRTFICNALMLGIPAEIVMKWTGHADYKSMKPYIDIADRAKAAAMNRFNEL